MKYFLLLLIAIFLQSCGYFGNNQISLNPSIESIQNTENGTLITFSADTNLELDIAGVEFRRPGEDDFPLASQIRQNGENSEILVPDLDNGTYEFRVFVIAEDYFNYSDIEIHEVIATAIEIPCSPPLNASQSNLPGVVCNSVNVSAEEGFFNTFDVRVECFTGFPIVFTFPRQPGGDAIYTTFPGSIDQVDSNERLVRMTYQTAFGGVRTLEFGQPVYVEREGNTLDITVCNIALDPNTSAVLSGKYRVEL